MSKGFTLVELLIVAVVLAIFAAIVVPKLGSVTSGANESALKHDLAMLRKAIERYRQDHSRFPAVVKSSGPGCSTGITGTGLAESPQALIDQLLWYTKGSGTACSMPENSFRHGPYLRTKEFPPNVMTNNSTIVVVPKADPNAGDVVLSPDGVGGGWKYDVVSGRIIANDSSLDSQGVRFDQY